MMHGQQNIKKKTKLGGGGPLFLARFYKMN